MSWISEFLQNRTEVFHNEGTHFPSFPLSWTPFSQGDQNGCQAIENLDLFLKQSGHFGEEFDKSDNPIALSQQAFFSQDLSHAHLGLCY